MKKHLLILLLLTPLILWGCQSEKTLDSDALAKKLLEEIIHEEMLEIKAERLGNFYPGLSSALSGNLFATTKVYLCAEAVLADEVAIFQLKEARSVAQVKSALNAHYQERVGIYSDYAPLEADRIKKRAFVEQDRWLIAVICDDPARATEIIKAAFK